MGDRMKYLIAISLLFCNILLTGCASIVSGQNQGVAIKTVDAQGREIAGARCELTNDDGKWLITTPNTASIDRSAQSLNIICKKDGISPGVLSVDSKTKGMAWGNILFGGIIGGAVDYNTGAAFDYPSFIIIEMGKTTNINGKHFKK